ncbi:alpha-L-rhamnosidase [Flavisolibacter nicotianae]|uniref:alpha-L-rhamnosidase n=1 Tax=Flavisolibacter nicotianae TaxID=2364882 RepID=UPI000EB379A7|nr:alpha-L-rhamnosidase [Flavisolibacter nicotianae]
MKKGACHIVLFVLLFVCCGQAFAFDGLWVGNLRCEMLDNPKGIDATQPRFSWQASVEDRGMKQTAYQVIVASSLRKLASNEGDLWNSGKVASDQSILVAYAGKPLQSRQNCFWKVQVWTNDGEVGWSQPASFSIGLLKPSDWNAKWIGLDRAFPWDSMSKFARLSARYFRKEVQLSKIVKKATVYIAGLGLYEFYVNGQKIGDQVLAPPPTDYGKRVLYNTFDVTSQLKQGQNALATVLGNGRFFTMRQNYKPKKWHTFGFPKLLLQLEVEFSDGTRQVVMSDGTWKATADGPIRTNNEYDGEEYDATKELTGWDKIGYDDHNWLKAEIVKAPGGMLVAQMNTPMKVMETIKPVSIKQLSNNKYILDMGQNMAGWLKLKTKGKRGDRIILRFAESLQPNGELYTANLRDAIVTDVYTRKGDGEETWCPTFVFHGFRYAEITGYPGVPTTNDFVGEVVYDDLKTTGTLETSSEIINQIHRNAFWGVRSNYKGMPIDCPQRNERQPWLGDRTMGAYGESFLFDNGRLYAKWLDDIADAQTLEGSIPDVAPSFWYYYKDNMTWPGAFLTISDMLYRQYGDVKPIQKHYPAMKKWMMYMKGKYMTKEGIVTKDSYGDWCVPPEAPELIHSKDSTRNTDPQLIATAYYSYFCGVMQRFAKLTGNTQDITLFETDAQRVKEAFNKKFYRQSMARYSNNTVTANLLPLAFGLVPASDTQKVFQNIVDKIMRENGGHISTGVIGTQWLMRWLTMFGRSDIAYQLASNTTYPSWGYMVKNGATTIWELWNGNTANPAMNSQNHVMLLGDLLIWLYENLGGIQSDTTEVGFKKIIMKPSFVADLSFVNASYQSPYGTIKINWKRDGENLSWQISVPGNATAIVYVPATSTDDVKERGQAVAKAAGVQFLRMEKGCAVLQVGSGHYSFTTQAKNPF